MIAEPWDCAGGYQLSIFQKYGFSEWNNQFRDNARRFIKGDSGSKINFIKTFTGSKDLFTSPKHTVNFITAHDGFTLNDLVSYEKKR